jgi:hypothetical protein
MIPSAALPRLTAQNHQITSPTTGDSNCIAWAAEDTENWWQPGVFWPLEVGSDDVGIGSLVQAFRFLDYEICAGGSLESGFLKVALYADGQFYTYAARQLPSGKWTSKLGRAEDIEHDTPEDVADGVYGSVVQFMKRPTATAG